MRIASICLFVTLLSYSVAAQKFSETIEGKWLTTNPQTRGMTSLIISQDGSGWSVQAWGKCHPRDCEWGSTPITAIGESVEDNSFNRGFAIWNAGFADKYVVVNLLGKILRVETITVFKDRSRRANFRSVEIMKRADESENVQ